MDMTRLPEPDAPGPHFAMGATAPQANRQEGERMVNDEVEWLGNQKMQELLAGIRGLLKTPHFPALDVRRGGAAVGSNSQACTQRF